jgi:hypothetical protein
MNGTESSAANPKGGYGRRQNAAGTSKHASTRPGSAVGGFRIQGDGTCETRDAALALWCCQPPDAGHPVWRCRMTVDASPWCLDCGHQDAAHDSLGCLYDCPCRTTGRWDPDDDGEGPQ